MAALRLRHPLLRSSSATSFRRGSNTTILPAIVTPLTLRVRLLSTGGYGDESYDLEYPNPHNQGSRPRADTEHPGPEPVAEGQGKGAIKGKAVPEDTRGTGADQGATNREANKRHHAGAIAGEKSNSDPNSQPKIHDAKKPGGEEMSDDVQTGSSARIRVFWFPQRQATQWDDEE